MAREHIDYYARGIPQPEVQWGVEEKETFRVKWKYITGKLKTCGYDFSKIKITKGKL